MMMWSNWESSWFMMWLMMVVSVGGFALLLFLALRADFAPRTRQPVNRRVTDARAVLALRLARGDIDATEYLERINALSEVHDA